MPLPLHGQITNTLISEIYGSIDDLIVEWEVRVANGQLPGPARERATIYRWLEKGIPEKTDELFSLASLIDCDPSAILDLETIFRENSFSDIRMAFQMGMGTKTPLRSMFGMFFMDPNWPDNKLARKYFGRDWCEVKFSHDAMGQLNEYADVQLSLNENTKYQKPHAYHFAYKRKNAPDMMWRPYGTVIRSNDDVRLYSESGAIEPNQTVELHTSVETFFGAGPADFKVVSITDFSLHLEYPSTSDNASRFDG